MCKTLIFIFLINSIFSFSQSEKLNQIYVDWENPKNFIKHNLKKVSCYNFEISNKGKVKKDSLLIESFIFNKENSIIEGINHNLLIILHGDGNERVFYKFKNQYINDTLILKKEKLEKPKFYKNTIETETFIELYQYDNTNQLIYKKNYTEENKYELFKKDTIAHFKSITYPKITEFEYDSKKRLIKEHFTRDSSGYYSKFDMKSDFKISKSCNSCEEKYLNQEWKYDDYKLLERTSYTYKKEKHTKENYFYDENQNLVLQIDSTGWYIRGKPYLDSTTEIVYNNDGKLITTIKNSDDIIPFHNKKIKYFDKNDFLIKETIHNSDNQIDIHEYIYENLILKHETIKYSKSEIIRFEYFYNKKGLLKEIKHFIDDKLVNIERYYYE